MGNVDERSDDGGSGIYRPHSGSLAGATATELDLTMAGFLAHMVRHANTIHNTQATPAPTHVASDKRHLSSSKSFTFQSLFFSILDFPSLKQETANLKSLFLF